MASGRRQREDGGDAGERVAAGSHWQLAVARAVQTRHSQFELASGASYGNAPQLVELAAVTLRSYNSFVQLQACTYSFFLTTMN
jgi:hypothetical protein